MPRVVGYAQEGEGPPTPTYPPWDTFGAMSAPPGRSRSRLVAGAAAVIVLVGAGLWFVVRNGDHESAPRPTLTGSVLERACALPPAYLDRIWRGYDPKRSEEIVIVPREPNFVGSFELTSHSGPWPYLQRVPLVLYGPERIEPQGQVPTSVTHADIYPTVGELLDVELEERSGRPLNDSLMGAGGTPRLVIVIVWDGAGRATLEHFPDAWPSLRRMETDGTSYVNATVGSSPSVTSAVHSTIGTGAWPKQHGIIGNELRTASGDLTGTFANLSSDSLRLTTFADQADVELGNESKVGMLAWNKWHLGLLGHGTNVDEADADDLALIHYSDGLKILGDENYAQVEGLKEFADPAAELDALDRSDGASDNKWLGNDISLGDKAEWDTYSNPAWAVVQGRLSIEMLDRGEYGRDEVADIWLTNFKMTDLAAHNWGLDSPETEAVLQAQDEALGEILDYLDSEVGDYVVMLTADHGSARNPTNTGAWPILQAELIEDVDRKFDVGAGDNLIESAAAAAYFIDPDVADRHDVSLGDIAAFLNDYTIEQNWAQDDLPEAYGGREDEQVFSAAFPAENLKEIRRCARSS